MKAKSGEMGWFDFSITEKSNLGFYEKLLGWSFVNYGPGYWGISLQADILWLVSFMNYDLGYFDEDSSRFEPLENPFRAKVLPMSSV